MQHKFSRFIPFILLPLYFLLVAPSPAHAQYLASDLLGQLDANGSPVFTSSTANNGEGATNSRGLSGGVDVSIDTVHHRLFFDDSSNRRILIFNLDSNNNLIDRVADYVIGQSDFVTGTVAASTTAATFHTNGPQCHAYDSVHDRLFVCDVSNNRVLVFDTSVITNGMSASYVLGQSNFASTTTAVTQSGMNTPLGAVYDSVNDRLFVQERSNNRILVFDVTSSTMSNGKNAIYVLGQTSFTSSTSLGTTQNGLSGSRSGLEYDAESSRLFVVSPDDRRVLVFDVTSSTMSNGKNASYVLGQTTFTSSTSAITQGSVGTPRGVAYDSVNKYLFIVDATSRRILVHNVATSTIANGQNAFAVLGQTNFTSSTAGVTQGLFATPFGNMAYDSANNRLYVTDNGNNRIMIYNLVSISNSTFPGGTTGDGYYQTINTSSSQGTVSFAITSGSLPTGLSLSGNRIDGGPTSAGTYAFSIQATDNNGSIGSFISHPQSFSITITTSSPRASIAVGNNNYAPAPQPTPAPLVLTPTVQPTQTYLPSTSITLEVPSNQTPTQVSVPQASTPVFTQNLKIKDKALDVKTLQQYLNSQGFTIAKAGPGSPDNETNFFGSFTKQALIKFQEAHADEILKPAGLTKGTGYFGPSTRAWVNRNQ